MNMKNPDAATRPLGAQISHMLKSRGVDVIFGIPGVHNQEMYRGIAEAGITHVLARHEQGAGFMADGYARASGRPGVAFVITGPGLCNILTPLGQAWSDSVPVLAISSCLDETAAWRGQFHQMRDQRAAAATVCAWSKEARDAASAYALIDRALSEFSCERKRPRHIQVPIQALEAQAPAPPAARPPVHGATAPVAAAGDAAAAIAEELRAAKRPLFVFGGGAVAGAARWREVVERAGAASFTTYAGRGIAAGHPLDFGAGLARAESAVVIASADLVVAVGTELAQTDLWRERLGHEGRLIRVDIDPAELCAEPLTSRAFQADAAALAEALLPLVGGAGRAGAGWQGAEVAEARARWKAECAAERPGIVPVCDALRAALPAETMIFSDMTQFAYAANEVWPMERAGHWHHPFGFGTLGYALPAAIGGAMARPGKPTLCIAGDYGFQYTLPELATAVELGLGLPILLWDNGKLKEIEDSMVRAQIAPQAVSARNPDFIALARAYGAHAEAPGSLDAVAEAVLAAFEADAPTLIHLRAGIAG